MRAPALILVLAACSTPPLTLVLAVSDADSEACGGTSCGKVPLACEAVVGIRIVNPKTPLQPFISMCEDVPNVRKSLCSLAQITLDQTLLPAENLEIQVVVFPREDLPRDADDKPICPANIEFDGSNGFPIGAVEVSDPANPDVKALARPAIGGRTFYHPGDVETVVNLGCPDLAALNAPSCQGKVTVEVTSTVIDFDTNQAVSIDGGNRLAVAIGEPKAFGVDYFLNPADTVMLTRRSPGPIPAWGDEVELTFSRFACLEVLDTVPQATATLTCEAAAPLTTAIDIAGTRLSKETLDEILVALGNPPLGKGLTIGIVLDEVGPAPNRTISTSPPGATIRYLSADGSNFNAGATTASGIFVSEDAPFGTIFQTDDQMASAVGGLVNNKVTIVPLRYRSPVVDP